MRFVNVLAILAMTGLGLTLFQNCSKSKFADSNVEMLEQASLSARTITINDDALYTNNASVRVQMNLEKPMWMYVTNDPTCAGGGEWQSYSPEIPWVLGSKNKESSVYVKFKTDYTESGCTSDSIVHDDIAPALAQMGSVAAITNVAGVNIALSASDAGSGVEQIICPLDVATCGNAVMVSNSVEGQRNVIFYAQDKAGNKSAPLNVSWLYDKTPPTFSVPDKPGVTSKDIAGSFRIVGSDNFTAPADIKYRRSLNDGAYVDVGLTFNVTVGEGINKISIEAFDKAGNKSDTYTYSWTVGTKLPSVIFTKTPKDYDNTKGSFEFSGVDQFKVALTKFECSLNGAAFASCTSPVDLAGANVLYGSNTFSVRGIDSLGMVGEKSHTWKFDNKKPVIGFTKKPQAFSLNSSEEVQVGLLAPAEDNLDSIEFTIDGASKQKSLLNNYVMSGLTETNHSVQVVAVDKAGNMSDPVNYSFWSDFTAPVVVIPALADYSSNKNQNINAQITDNNKETANVLKYYYQLDGLNTYTQFPSLPLQLLNLNNGAHFVTIYALDMAGNKSLVVPSESIYIDLLAPTISIIKKPADNVATGSHSIINFTVNDVGSGIKIGSLACSITKAGVKTALPCGPGVDLDILNDIAAQYDFDISISDNLNQVATAKISWVAAQMFQGHTTAFSVSQIIKKDVDILFLIGNDQSMGPVLTKIGNAFSGFMSNLSGLNWRLAITTTDFSGENEGSSGNILRFGNNAYYLTPNSGTSTQIDTWFKARLNVGTNQSQNANKDKALTAMHQFIDKTKVSTTKEKDFYRPDAVLVTIIVDHRDEITEGNTLYTTSDIFLNGNNSGSVLGLYDRLGADKAYLNHSSVVTTTACEQQGGYMGTTYMNVSRDTGGINESICSSNYAAQMNNFGNAILTKVSQIQLECAPVDEAGDGQVDISISLTVNGSTSIVDKSIYVLDNDVVRFVVPPNTVGSYSVNYTCLSWAK